MQAIRADVSSRRVAAFVKRLLQVAAACTANFAAGSLFLLSELLKVRPRRGKPVWALRA